jgi:hypothetical protein
MVFSQPREIWEGHLSSHAPAFHDRGYGERFQSEAVIGDDIYDRP